MNLKMIRANDKEKKTSDNSYYCNYYYYYFELKVPQTTFVVILNIYLDVLVSCSPVKLIIYLCLDMVGSHHCPNNFFFFHLFFFFQFIKNLWNSSLELLRLLKENVI